MPPSTDEATVLLRQYRVASRKDAGNIRLEVLTIIAPRTRLPSAITTKDIGDWRFPGKTCDIAVRSATVAELTGRLELLAANRITFPFGRMEFGHIRQLWPGRSRTRKAAVASSVLRN
jgi:hypothetical protein